MRKTGGDCQTRSEESGIAQSGDLGAQPAMELLDQCYFLLPEEAFDRFNAILDNPPASNPGLERLLKSKLWL
jgi:hypothetical protein